MNSVRQPHSLLSVLKLLARVFRLSWCEERKLTVICLITGCIWPVMGIAQPLLLGHLIDLITARDFDAAYRIIGIWGAAIVTFMASLYANRLASDHIKHRLKTTVGLLFSERALGMDYDFYARTHSSWLLKVLNKGDEALGSVAHEMLGWSFGYVVLLICVIPAAFWINPIGGCVILGIFFVIASTLFFLFNRTARLQGKLEDMMTRIYTEAGDAFANAVPLQSYTAVPWVLKRIHRLLHRRLKWQTPLLNWWAMSNSLMQAAERLSLIAITLVGTWLVSRGQLTPGQLGGFILLVVYVVPYLVALYERFERCFWSYVHISDLLDVIDSRPMVKDAPDAQPLAVTGGHIAFENVSFNYPMRTDVLQNISFDILPGQTVALVGATGAGKTTIARLMMRYYEPSAGRILIDGQDAQSVKIRSLRDSITVLFQDSFVLNQNIANNLRMGRDGMDEGTLMKAARDSLFQDVIDTMPKGLTTQLGERGIKLSGGEKQRLAIARAVLRDTKILILDEATSSLDAATEAVLQESLKTLTRGRSTLVIAHRLSTIRHADQILVLQKGRIVERGTYADLLAMNGIFTGLVAAQRDGMIVE